MKFKFIFHFLFWLSCFWFTAPMISCAQVPEIGAQIWLEPGQSKAQIDGWFKTLADHKMKVTRLFVMWNYLEPKPNQWDFSLYDAAFESAEKHNIKIVATLMPNHGPAHRGFYYKVQDGAIPKTQKQLAESRLYIQTLVKRYAESKALDSWMLMNEPGQFPSDDSLAITRFKVWLSLKYGNIDKLNQAWMSDFKDFNAISYSPNWAGGGFTWPVSYVDWQTFWRSHMSWYLGWVAVEVQKYDSKHGIHINPHALLDILSKFDLPSWRSFLSSLGCSIHPVWHFNSLERNQFTLGVSWVDDMIRGASEPNPFWTTELQGGHNIYTAKEPIRPTVAEINSWLWTSIGAGAQKTIFWCLNPRSKGTESGEWAMVDYQNKPSERLTASGEIASVIEKNSDFFSTAKPYSDDVSIILSLESMTMQERGRKTTDAVDGRNSRSHYTASMSVYKALKNGGIHPSIKHIHDMNWGAKTAKPRLAILSDAEGLTDKNITDLETFVRNGNKLLITGLTGLYDAEEGNRPMAGRFPDSLVGGQLAEVTNANLLKMNRFGKIFSLKVATYGAVLKATSGKAILDEKGQICGIENKFGNGNVVWLPYKVDVAGWKADSKDFENWIVEEAGKLIDLKPKLKIKNDSYITLKILENANEWVSIISSNQQGLPNYSQKRSLNFEIQNGYLPSIIFGEAKSMDFQKKQLTLAGTETIVIRWKKAK